MSGRTLWVTQGSFSSDMISYMKLIFFFFLTAFSSAQLQEALDRAVAEGTPGMAVIVFDQEKIMARAEAGHRSSDQKEAITKDDLWHIGSNGKAMTATLMARLVERGLIGWNTPLAKVFPKESRKFHPLARTITLEQLLSHTSGLPANPHRELVTKARAAGDKRISRQRLELTETMLARAPLHQPGSRYLYSNTGYIIAGAIAGKLLKTSWERAMRKEVFEPLGMKTPGFGAPNGKNPRGHLVSVKGTRQATFTGYLGDNPAIYGPAGGIHLSLDDWLKFARDHLGAHQLLRRESYVKLHQPVLNNYALGWGTRERGGKITRLAHDGSNTLWYARISLWLSRGKGFVIVANDAATSTKKAVQEIDMICAGILSL